ncbi:MAG TPA: iron hydrogenase small subunit [Deltaproteobacteria bacterium]|mgnify:CR=1 FL=1|nr:iron hydrogenase small subunit [Deltaproteobacteria bacterium]HPR56159.1 iron hydrogenase small subunit [Deltaproteobacteria bacterium]HXK47717.1 iron hydrogenase small subunit [Deltaproteobacteria bacterium]
MGKKDYQYMENPFQVTRREFLSITGAIAAFTALPAVWVRSRVTKRNNYLRARAAGLYLDDRNAKIRVSHGNPVVTKIYDEFAHAPLSEISEALFHTRYINRSKGIA